MMWHSIFEKVRYDSKYRGMTRHRYPVAALVPPVASELHSMLDWWWIASLLSVWQPSTVSFTILYHGPCYQFIPVHSKSNYCLGTCFVFFRMETPLFRIVRFGAVCTLISRQRPPTIASGIFPIEAQASSCLSSTSHHLISVSTSLLWNSQVTTEHLPPHFWDILISSTLPSPLSSTVWEVGKTNLSFLAGGEGCRLPSITLVDVRKHSELLSNVWVIFFSFWESKNRVKEKRVKQ